jgi:hypothetical protein
VYGIAKRNCPSRVRYYGNKTFKKQRWLMG